MIRNPKSAGRWAVFDVDGTLLPGTSLEKQLIATLFRRRMIPLANLLCCMGVASHGLRYATVKQAFYTRKCYLRNLYLDDICPLIREMMHDQVYAKLSQHGRRQIESCRSAGYQIMLLSGAPDILIEPLADYLGADSWGATVLERREGRFTGGIRGTHPYEAGKRDLLQDRQAELRLDLGNSIAYANHGSDAVHMALFGRAVAVNPDKVLKQSALQHRWAIEYWQ